jgi:predicted alpha/beta hydrolase
VSETVAIRCADGWVLRGARWRNDEARAIVVCGHAMMVDRRTLDRPRGGGLASLLAARGLEVLALDSRGHGESVPRADHGARWSYDDIVRQDVPAAIEWARSIANGRRVIVLGHSLVGHAAMIWAGLGAGPDAIVGYATNLWAPHLEPNPIARAAKGALLRAWSAATRARGFYDARSFGHGTAAEPAPYVEQFARMWSRDRLESPDGAIDYEAALARASLPVLVYSSEGDRLLARPPAVERFLALMTHARVEHRVLRGDDAPDHMGLVIDPRSRPIWEQTARWIEDEFA